MKKGFTLIELLVVVLIIGILSSVALPQYSKAVKKAKMVEAITILKSITDAQEIYYIANGEYTTDLESLDISAPAQTENYTFQCKKESPSTCYAFGKKGNVTFEFYLKNVDSDIGGKHWCVASAPASHAFCKTLGPLDMGNTTEKGYYLLN